ncbi:hypothetical protein ACH4TV_44335 [Streptomyces sp. NPDC020898]|uniref:hypothetical protein n=1 Tax=Streptomyces sp. NPDC020898 TaxID=3365101 RepID=UPI0037911783
MNTMAPILAQIAVSWIAEAHAGVRTTGSRKASPPETSTLRRAAGVVLIGASPR